MASSDPAVAAERRRRLAILGGLWLSVALVLVVFRNVVLPFAGAALIAYVAAPLVERICSWRIFGRTPPRWTAILLIYAAFFLLVYLFFIALVPQLYRELLRISRDALDYANSLTPDRVQQIAHTAEQWLTERGVPVSLSRRALEGADGAPAAHAFSFSLDLQKLIEEGALRASAAVRENLSDLSDIFKLSTSVIASVLTGVFTLFFILMVGAFFSVDTRAIRAYGRGLIPPEYTGDARVLIARIDRSLAGVVRGQLIICLVNGVLTFCGLMLLGVKFAFLLATVAMTLSLIPIFGSILSSFPIVLIGAAQSWRTGLAALAWILGIHALEAYLLNPKILGTAARIHPLVVAFALIAGERTFGLVGALFAVPIAAIAVACFDFARQKAVAGVEPAVEPARSLGRKDTSA